MKNCALQLKDIIKYLEKIDNVVLWQTDCFIDDRDEDEKVFEGSIMDIPWTYLSYYLVNDENGEAISARNYGDGKTGFVISICESYDRLPRKIEF